MKGMLSACDREQVKPPLRWSAARLHFLKNYFTYVVETITCVVNEETTTPYF